MPDNWDYVASAYLVAALLLGLYWRHLVRRTADLSVKRRRAATLPISSARAPRSAPARPEPGAHGPRP
jgi:hypothetical protein